MARDPYKYFRIEARDLTDQLGQSVIELERAGSGGEVVPRLLRLAHTLKGAARVVRQPAIADEAHSIEDLLTPFREQTTAVPRASIEALLGLLDSITGRIAALAAPEQAEAVAPSSNAPAAASASPDASIAVRGDVNEIDDLLDGVTEVGAQLGSLRDLGAMAARAKRMADQIFEQLSVDIASGITGTGIAEAQQAAETLRSVGSSLERGITATHGRVERELRQVRDAAEQLRLVPAGALFATFERAARDSAQVLGKEILFEGKGGEIRLDAQTVRLVQDAVLQLVRNAVAHGIEVRRDRIAIGKPPLGRVAVTVSRRGSRIVLRCEDDGRGIDAAALREAAVKKGRPAAEVERLPVVDLLLQGGVSTSAFVSEVAGRGIGMDIVREAVARLGAQLVVTTTQGRGTQFELAVPLSVSSVESLLLEAAGARASLPLHAVRHTLRLEPSSIHRTSLGEAIIHDGQAIPLVPLTTLLGRGAPARRTGSLSAVIVASGNGLAAVSVSRLPGTGNIVFRPLPELAPATAAIAGASLDGDGNPLLMLDPEGLVAMALQHETGASSATVAKRPLLVIDDSLTTRMLEQSILESAGYEVDVAMSAEEGLERVQLRDYALILVDVEMPGMDGFGFIETIRRDPRLRDTPAILVTSRNAPADKRRGKDVGAQGYVVKSEFDQGELLNNIERLVA